MRSPARRGRWLLERRGRGSNTRRVEAFIVRGRLVATALVAMLAPVSTLSCEVPTPPAAVVSTAPPDGGAATFLVAADASMLEILDAGFVPLDAGVEPVRVGLLPTPVAVFGDGGNDPAVTREQLEADVELVAAGARSVILEIAWDELVPDGKTVDAHQLRLLGQRARFFAGANVTVSMTFSVLRGTVDRRPPALRMAWSDKEVLLGYRTAVGALLDECGDAFRRLSVALFFDRWLDEADDAGKADSAEFLISALDAARGHPSAHSNLEVGVETSIRAAMSPGPELQRVLDASDTWLLVALPSAADGRVAAPSDAAHSILEDMRALSSQNPTVSVVLHRVGFPSATSLGASAEAQAEFYRVFFAGVEEAPQLFRSLNVWGLNDLSRADCEDLATEFGQPISAGFLELFCSLGLKDTQAVAKPAWDEFLTASARFFSR